MRGVFYGCGVGFEWFKAFRVWARVEGIRFECLRLRALGL